MTIENGLEELTGEKGEIKQAESSHLIIPSNLLPVEKILTTFQKFSHARTYLGDEQEDYEIDTADLIKTLDEFKPYHTFYRELRNGFDRLSYYFSEWNKCFEGTIDPELFSKSENSTKVPDSVNGWLLDEINTVFNSINEADCKIDHNATNDNWLVRNVEHVNSLVTELHNKNGLIDSVLIVRTLASRMANINYNFSVHEDGKNLDAAKYLDLINQLGDFAVGKTRISYRLWLIHKDKLGGLTDLSPRPPQKKKPWYVRLFEDD